MYHRHLPRAKTPGQTRASDSVRRVHRHQDRPLPFRLQVYPPVKRRTPKHPMCGQSRTQWGTYLRLLDATGSASDYVDGFTLSTERETYVITCEGRIAGYHADGQYALGWVHAARAMGLDAAVYNIPDDDKWREFLASLIRTIEEDTSNHDNQ